MRRILPIACVAFAFTVALNAQTSGSSTQGTAAQPKGSSAQKSQGMKSGGRTVTLTGCLREGDTPGTYQLTNVDMSSMGAKSGKGTSAHTGTATSGGSTSGTEAGSQAGMGNMATVALTAGGSVDLKEHVGHKVQVTGTWSSAGTGSSGTPGAEGTSGYNAETRRTNLGSAASVGGSSAGSQVGGTSTPTSGDQTGAQSSSQAGKKQHDMSGRQLTVKSLKHISDTCQ